VLLFGCAALLHAGVLMPEYEHEATIAEAVISLVLIRQ
jgi:hypothetical protein